MDGWMDGWMDGGREGGMDAFYFLQLGEFFSKDRFVLAYSEPL